MEQPTIERYGPDTAFSGLDDGQLQSLNRAHALLGWAAPAAGVPPANPALRLDTRRETAVVFNTASPNLSPMWVCRHFVTVPGGSPTEEPRLGVRYGSAEACPVCRDAGARPGHANAVPTYAPAKGVLVSVIALQPWRVDTHGSSVAEGFALRRTRGPRVFPGRGPLVARTPAGSSADTYTVDKPGGIGWMRLYAFLPGAPDDVQAELQAAADAGASGGVVLRIIPDGAADALLVRPATAGDLTAAVTAHALPLPPTMPPQRLAEGLADTLRRVAAYPVHRLVTRTAHDPGAGVRAEAGT